MVAADSALATKTARELEGGGHVNRVAIPPEFIGPLWSRLPGESALWFSRFGVYRKLGPHRSIWRARTEAWTLEGHEGLPKTRNSSVWHEIANYWRWMERACAWDEHLSEVENAAEEEARRAARFIRRDLLKVYTDKVALIVGRLDPEVQVSLRDAAAAVRIALDESRTEFGEIHPQQIQVSSPPGELVSIRQDTSMLEIGALAAVLATLSEAGVIPPPTQLQDAVDGSE